MNKPFSVEHLPIHHSFSKYLSHSYWVPGVGQAAGNAGGNKAHFHLHNLDTPVQGGRRQTKSKYLMSDNSEPWTNSKEGRRVLSSGGRGGVWIRLGKGTSKQRPECSWESAIGLWGQGGARWREQQVQRPSCENESGVFEKQKGQF